MASGKNTGHALFLTISLAVGLAACSRTDLVLGRLDGYIPPEPAPEEWIAFFHSHGQLLDRSTMSEWETNGGSVALDGLDASTFPRGTFGMRTLWGYVRFTNIAAMRNLWFLSGIESMQGDSHFSGPDLVSLDGLEDLQTIGVGSDIAVVNTAGGRVGGLHALENLQWINWGGGLAVSPAGGSTLSLTRLGAPQGTDCADLGELRLDGHEISTLTVVTNGPCGAIAINNGPLADLSGIKPGAELCGLSLSGNNIVDVAPLAVVSIRGYLSLAYNPLSDIGPLASASYAGTLPTLSLAGTQVASLAPLSAFTALNFVDVSDTPVTDLTPLVGKANLTTLGLGNVALNQAGLDALGTLPALSRLEGHLSWAGRGISDLTPLTRIRDLGVGGGVDLANNALTSLAGLESVSSVGTLFDLRGNPGLATVAQLLALRGQGGAGQLYLPENITDISGLSGFIGDSTAPDTLVLPVPSLITTRATAASPLCNAIDAGTVLIANGAKSDVCDP